MINFNSYIAVNMSKPHIEREHKKRSSKDFFRVFLKITASILGALTMNACSGLNVTHEVRLDFKGYARARNIVKAADDGFFLIIEHVYSGTVLKLDSEGNIVWSFEESFGEKLIASVQMVTALPDGGALVCGARSELPPSTKARPGFVLRLDAKGHEIARLDFLKKPVEGRPILAVTGCGPWGDGFVITAQEPREAGEADDTGVVTPLAFNRSFVGRLNPDLSVAWRRPLPLGVSKGFPSGPPRELADGSLVVQAWIRAYRIDSQGQTLAGASMEHCKWLVNSPNSDSRLRFVCQSTGAPGDAHSFDIAIIEYDSYLNLINKIKLIDQRSFADVICIPDGSFITFSGGEKGRNATVTVYNVDGHQTSMRSLSHGMLGGGFVTYPERVAIVAWSEENKLGITPVITWIKL